MQKFTVASVWNYLNKNKEWMFSGVGIVIVAGLWGLFRHDAPPATPVTANTQTTKAPLPTAVQASSPASAPAATTALTHPEPEEILKQIDQQTPYAAKAVAKSFVGLRVRWKTHFNDLDFDTLNAHPERPSVNIYLYSSQGRVMIVCNVSLTEHAQFRTMRKNDPVTVEGTISTVSTYIKLEQTAFTFP